MLYLFNSAYRPLYAANALNTLYLPTGYTNEYRYRHTGEPRYVSPAVFEAMPRFKAGKECVIVFVDRYSGNGYIYYPFRFGKYVTFRNVNEYTHLTIELGDFVYPRDLAASNQHLIQAIGTKGLPRLTDNDPDNRRDGNYVIDGDSIFGHAADFIRGEEAWNANVDAFSGTRMLRTDETQSPIFLRVDIQRNRKRLNPKLKNDSSVFSLAKKTPYDLVFTYRYPRQRIDATAVAEILVETGDNLILLGSSRLRVNTHANSVVVPFSSKKYPEETVGVVKVSPMTPGGPPSLMLTQSDVRYKFSEPAFFVVQIWCALLLYSLFTALLGVDFSKLDPITVKAVLAAAWPKALLGLPQAIALFWLFWLVGKKVL
jgi:hypothetical protein